VPAGSLLGMAADLRALVASTSAREAVPGYVAAVWHQGEYIEIAHGVADAGTGALMVPGCAFPLGSITKVLTTALLLRFMERGLVDLDDRVSRHLPELRLLTGGHAQRLRIRNLLNHTNGIDADTLLPEHVHEGRDVLADYVERLAGCGTLFDVGKCVSYSNPGFVVAGRVLEVVSGQTFGALLARELFAPAGMVRCSTLPRRALQGPSATGHHRGGLRGAAASASRWTLPGSGAPAGTTASGTVADLVRFGRLHLQGGRCRGRAPLLSEAMTAAMRAVTADMGTPNCPPVGLGWWLPAFGSATVLLHSGASPGGRSMLMVFPAHELVLAAYGNAAQATAVHDEVSLMLAQDLLGLDPEAPAWPEAAPGGVNLAPYTGSFREFQFTTDVAQRGGVLCVSQHCHPSDPHHARLLEAFTGADMSVPTTRLLRPLSTTLFAPEGIEPEAFRGLRRRELLSFHRTDATGRFSICLQGNRIAVRQPNPSPEADQPVRAVSSDRYDPFASDATSAAQAPPSRSRSSSCWAPCYNIREVVAPGARRV
jgi:CubicO group peptidase (beta-lactamase class C family)